MFGLPTCVIGHESKKRNKIMKSHVLISKNIKEIIIAAFDCLRGEVSTESYTIIPFLLLSYRLGLGEKYVNDVYDPLLVLGNEYHEDVIPERVLINYFFYELDRYNTSTIQQANGLIKRLDPPNMTADTFEAAFDYALDSGIQALGRKAGEWQQPAELAQLVCSLYEISPNARIFNPYAGTCHLASFLDQSVQYTGQEENLRIHALGQLRVIAHRLRYGIVKRKDSAQDWPLLEKWDFIFSTSPLMAGRRTDENSYAGLPHRTRLDVILIHQTLAHLEANGKAVVAVFPEFLWRSGSTVSFRQHLVEQEWLETVIEFPAGILSPSASVGFSLLLFNATKKNRGWVKFVDAEFHISGQKRQRIINVESILEATASPDIVNGVALVANTIIALNEYNLSARRYTAGQEVHEKDVELGAIARVVRRRQLIGSVGQSGRLVSPKALKVDNLNYRLDVSSLPIELRQPGGISEVAPDVLLIHMQGHRLKPTWYQADKSVEQAPVFVTPLIQGLDIDREKVDVAYLVSELNSDYVASQLKAYQVGTTIPRLHTRDLLKIRIRLPSIEEQKAKVEGQQEVLVKVKQLEEYQLGTEVARKDEAFTQFASFKHAFLQPLANLRDGVDLLQDCLKDQEAEGKAIDFNALLGFGSKRTVQDLFNSLSRDFAFIEELLKRKESDLRVKDYNLEPVDLVTYLNSFEVHLNLRKPGFQLIVDVATDISSSYGNKLEVMAHEHLLNTLLNYIISNAERHGFSFRRDAGDKILIEVAISGESEKLPVNIVISNNGNPFSKNLTKEKYIKPGYKSGSMSNEGIGGADINEIISHFGGEFELLNNYKPDFQAGISIFLPLPDTAEATDDETLQNPLD